MTSSRNKPLIVQSDRTIFLEVDHPDFKVARDGLMRFAELEKSPEHIYVYRITPISLWNAAASGLSKDEILSFLADRSRFPVPSNIRKEISEHLDRYGRLRLQQEGEEMHLVSPDPEVIDEVARMKTMKEFIRGRRDASTLVVDPVGRGRLKLALIKIGYPVEDLAGYREGAHLDVQLRDATPSGESFSLRGYQVEAVDAFHAGGGSRGGSGVIVLPCGAGKTMVGLGVMARTRCHTLVLSTSIAALRQWRRELLDKTNLPEDAIGEYSGEVKDIRPVTLSTYHILTYRKARTDPFVHFVLLSRGDWGLVIYDEVHLLPAPVFRVTAEIQATRRLGLTATLIREDGREDEVFSLVGPKRYDIPWRMLEGAGWIANARCVEIRVDLDPELRQEYATSGSRHKFRLASENPGKLAVVKELVGMHDGDLVLVIGQYLDQLREIQRQLRSPIITGATPNREREELYRGFREGRIPVLIVSKVGNFAIDLPDASVAIQVSGTFGSRQEEAQRLGRILRPKRDGAGAVFYSVVTRGTKDQEFAEKRQLFLTEQGYEYQIRDTVPAREAERPLESPWT